MELLLVNFCRANGELVNATIKERRRASTSEAAGGLGLRAAVALFIGAAARDDAVDTNAAAGAEARCTHLRVCACPDVNIASGLPFLSRLCDCGHHHLR